MIILDTHIMYKQSLGTTKIEKIARATREQPGC